MKTSRIKSLLPFIVLSLCIYIAYLITQGAPPASYGQSHLPDPLLVEARVLKPADYDLQFESFGLVQAKNQTELLPLVSGKVVKVYESFQSGAYFRQGDKLLEIEKSDYEVQLQIAKGDLANAELTLEEELARTEQALRDWKKQQARDASAQASDYALRKPQLRAAQANLASAQAKLKLAELNVERTTLRAPYDGRVKETFVGLGSVVNTSSPLAILFDTSVIEVRLPINNADLPFIDLSGKATGLSALSVIFENQLAAPVEYWRGRIDRSEASLESVSQQLYLIAQIDAHAETQTSEFRQELKIGQFLKATIHGKRLEQVISIPNTAIYQGTYVYLVEPENVAGEPSLDTFVIRRQHVDILWRDAHSSLVRSGLSTGQQLVTTPLGQVTSGTRVQAQLVPSVDTGDVR